MQLRSTLELRMQFDQMCLRNKEKGLMANQADLTLKPALSVCTAELPSNLCLLVFRSSSLGEILFFFQGTLFMGNLFMRKIHACIFLTAFIFIKSFGSSYIGYHLLTDFNHISPVAFRQNVVQNPNATLTFTSHLDFYFVVPKKFFFKSVCNLFSCFRVTMSKCTKQLFLGFSPVEKDSLRNSVSFLL